MSHHPQCKLAGFITDAEPNLKDEISNRVLELQIFHDVEIGISSFSKWVDEQIKRFELNEDEVGHKWIIAITESICLKKRKVAPIDEPTGEWVSFLKSKFKSFQQH